MLEREVSVFQSGEGVIRSITGPLPSVEGQQGRFQNAGKQRKAGLHTSTLHEGPQQPQPGAEQPGQEGTPSQAGVRWLKRHVSPWVTAPLLPHGVPCRPSLR